MKKVRLLKLEDEKFLPTALHLKNCVPSYSAKRSEWQSAIVSMVNFIRSGAADLFAVYQGHSVLEWRCCLLEYEGDINCKKQYSVGEVHWLDSVTEDDMKAFFAKIAEQLDCTLIMHNFDWNPVIAQGERFGFERIKTVAVNGNESPHYLSVFKQ